MKSLPIWCLKAISRWQWNRQWRSLQERYPQAMEEPKLDLIRMMPEDEVEEGDFHHELVIEMATNLPLQIANLIPDWQIVFYEATSSVMITMNHKPDVTADQAIMFTVTHFLYETAQWQQITWVHCCGKVSRTRIKLSGGKPQCLLISN